MPITRTKKNNPATQHQACEKCLSFWYHFCQIFHLMKVKVTLLSKVRVLSTVEINKEMNSGKKLLSHQPCQYTRKSSFRSPRLTILNMNYDTPKKITLFKRDSMSDEIQSQDTKAYLAYPNLIEKTHKERFSNLQIPRHVKKHHLFSFSSWLILCQMNTLKWANEQHVNTRLHILMSGTLKNSWILLVPV